MKQDRAGAVLVDDPGHGLALVADGLLAVPQKGGAVHVAVRVHGPGGGLDVDVRLHARLGIAVEAGVDRRRGRMASVLPVLHQGLGAGLSLFRRRIAGQLDHLLDQETLGGPALPHDGGLLDPGAGVLHVLAFPGGAFELGGLVRLLARRLARVRVRRRAVFLALAPGVVESGRGRGPAAHLEGRKIDVTGAGQLPHDALYIPYPYRFMPVCT